jgi:hypothetical protein
MVSENQTGFIADPFDIDAFSARVGILLQDKKKARQMGEAGYARFKTEFVMLN